MKIECYDYVCSLGSSCLCACSLRDAGLRLSSGPFDWLLGPSLLGRVETIVADFANWFEEGDFEFLGDPNNFNHDSYLNRRTGYKFSHDFEKGKPLSEGLSPVREKYLRRIARFYEKVRNAHRVLFVWLENPMVSDHPTATEVVRARELLTKKFPWAAIDLLVVDRAADNAATGDITFRNGCWRVSCGYRTSEMRGRELRPWDIDTRPILRILSRFSVVDDRSTDDRRLRRAAERAYRYAACGARGPLGYIVARLQVRICKLLLNGLRRRGADLRRLFESQLGNLR